MKASRQFQKQPASSATPISQTSKRLQTRPFRDPNAPTMAQPSQSSLPATDYDPSSRPAWWDRLTFNPQRPSTVQAKLTVGAPNDVYEQEANRVADQVMSMPDTATQQPVQREAMPEEELQTKPLAAAITPLVQREAMPEEEESVQAKASGNADIQREAMPEEEEVQTKPLASGTLQREEMAPEEEDLQMKPLGTADLQREAMPEEEDALQTKSLGTADLQREALPEEDEPLQTKPSPSPDSPLPTPSLETQLSNTQGSGSPLPNDVRSFMEPRFGADFSQVRVHTGSDAVQMNRDLNAQAFTHKQDIYFGAGKASSKDSLTAHELTHVVQQTGKNSTANEKTDLSNYVQRSDISDRADELAKWEKRELDGQDIISRLNPETRGKVCELNCPAAAGAVANYLETGKENTELQCDPMSEQSFAWDISGTKLSKPRNWKTTFQQIKQRTPKHGSFVVVETLYAEGIYHYFVVVKIQHKQSSNIKNGLYVIDAYGEGQVTSDADSYGKHFGQNARFKLVQGQFHIKRIRS